MTAQEHEYMRQALEALESPEATPWAQHKILRTMSQVCNRHLTDIESRLIGEFDAVITRNYQNLQNQRLVDILSN